MKNVCNNNKESHFKIILQNKGFILVTLGQKKTIKESKQIGIKIIIKENIEEKFNNYFLDNENSVYDDYEKRRKI